MKRHSLSLLFIAEIFSSAIGFGVMITLARRLGPASFADYEYGAAVAAWWLVLVRGGFDSIVYREAARHPRLIRPLTSALIALRLVAAVVGLAVILGWSWFLGAERGRIVVVAGLILLPSAFATDLGLRASCRFGWLALVQTLRSLGLAVGVGVLVCDQSDALLAAECVVMAEFLATLILICIYCFEYGSTRLRFRPKLWVCLAVRGSVAGATRFARVSLYALDLLIVASLASASDLGPFAAARRVAYAVLALGLVVPAAVGPRFARAWLAGPTEARAVIATAFERMLSLVLPATIGLVLTAHRWMPLLFGEAFREGGPWLALIAARLPFVLVSNVQQSALIAFRQEGRAWRLLSGMVVLALVTLPPLALWQGAWGVAWGILGIEICGAIAGWFSLARLGVAPRCSHASGPVWVGCAALLLICSIGQDWPLIAVVITGICTYGLILALLDQRAFSLSAIGLRSPFGAVSGGTSP